MTTRGDVDVERVCLVCKKPLLTEPSKRGPRRKVHVACSEQRVRDLTNKARAGRRA